MATRSQRWLFFFLFCEEVLLLFPAKLCSLDARAPQAAIETRACGIMRPRGNGTVGEAFRRRGWYEQLHCRHATFSSKWLLLPRFRRLCETTRDESICVSGPSRKIPSSLLPLLRIPLLPLLGDLVLLTAFSARWKKKNESYSFCCCRQCALFVLRLHV